MVQDPPGGVVDTSTADRVHDEIKATFMQGVQGSKSVKDYYFARAVGESECFAFCRVGGEGGRYLSVTRTPSEERSWVARAPTVDEALRIRTRAPLGKRSA